MMIFCVVLSVLVITFVADVGLKKLEAKNQEAAREWAENGRVL